jgi:hypothetical protein
MDNDGRFWVSVWAVIGTVALVFFGMFFSLLKSDHIRDVERDKFLLSHCKVVQQTVGSTASTKEFNCKEQ